MSIGEEILKSLAPLATKQKDIEFLRRYFNTELQILGVTVPFQRKLVKKGFSFFREDEKKVFAAWEEVWNETRCLEAMTLPLIYYADRKESLNVKWYWSKLSKWATDIDNWVHSDSLSNLYAHFLEQEPKLVLPVLQKWNRSSHPWLRRQSIVSLFYYARGRKKFVPYKTAIQLVEPLVEDGHFYVQRGVGWTLRELRQAYKKETDAFLRREVHRLSAIAFSAATEKIPLSQKAKLKQLRR